MWFGVGIVYFTIQHCAAISAVVSILLNGSDVTACGLASLVLVGFCCFIVVLLSRCTVWLASTWT